MAGRCAPCTPTDRSVSSIRARLGSGGGDNPSPPPNHSQTRVRRARYCASAVPTGGDTMGWGGGDWWWGGWCAGTGVPAYVPFPVSNPFVRLCLCHWAFVSVRKTFLSFRFTVLTHAQYCYRCYYIINFFPSVSRWFLLLSSSLLLLSKRINIYYYSWNSSIFYYLFIILLFVAFFSQYILSSAIAPPPGLQSFFT